MKLDDLLKEMKQPVPDAGFADRVLRQIPQAEGARLSGSWIEFAGGIGLLILAAWVFWSSGIAAQLHRIPHLLSPFTSGMGLIVCGGLLLLWAFADDEPARIFL